MPYPQLDRSRLRFRPLAERKNKVSVERDFISPEAPVPALPLESRDMIRDTVKHIRAARRHGRPVMLTFGAHTIKNGLGPVLIRLMEEGWIQHLATNGAGIIHDWEFAFQGCSSEDVRANVAQGEFGMWQETGFHLNLALLLGAYDGLGYGESVGRLIQTEQHLIPSRKELEQAWATCRASCAAPVDASLKRSVRAGKPRVQTGSLERAAAAADLLAALDQLHLAEAKLRVPHPYQATSVQAAAYRLGIPFTGHPMIGHDIFYVHPLNSCAAIGRTAQRDFLTFAEQVSRLDGGVYLSIGSAVMSPMIFEKSMSMAQNLALQDGRRLEKHFMLVVDLQPSRWDWRQGEPPQDSPDYYLRYCKSFSRMGGTMRYLCADNRDFLLTLAHELKNR